MYSCRRRTAGAQRRRTASGGSTGARRVRSAACSAVRAHARAGPPYSIYSMSTSLIQRHTHAPFPALAPAHEHILPTEQRNEAVDDILHADHVDRGERAVLRARDGLGDVEALVGEARVEEAPLLLGPHALARDIIYGEGHGHRGLRNLRSKGRWAGGGTGGLEQVAGGGGVEESPGGPDPAGRLMLDLLLCLLQKGRKCRCGCAGDEDLIVDDADAADLGPDRGLCDGGRGEIAPAGLACEVREGRAAVFLEEQLCVAFVVVL